MIERSPREVFRHDVPSPLAHSLARRLTKSDFNLSSFSQRIGEAPN
jgi:hypothetical protein